MQQNDIIYVQPWDPTFEKFSPDEPSGIWTLGWSDLNPISSRLKTEIDTGICLSRIKGAILTNGNADQTPHFHHGLGDFGPYYRYGLTFDADKHFSVSVSSLLTGGVSVSDFSEYNSDDPTKNVIYSQGLIRLGWLDHSVPTWSSHGFGLTLANSIDFNLGFPNFKLSVGFTNAFHFVQISPYSSPTLNRQFNSTNLFLNGSGMKVGFYFNIR
jgi:hypothetical protein